MITKRGPRSAATSGGFTLLEILIALVVLSVGLLGTAAMQYSSLRANHHALLRSQATFLAYDMIDRMRANRAAAMLGEYNVDTTGGGAAVAPGNPVAAADVTEWLALLQTTLPGGAGAVTVDASTRRVSVRVEWTERAGSNEPGAAGPMRFDVGSDL